MTIRPLLVIPILASVVAGPQAADAAGPVTSVVSLGTAGAQPTGPSSAPSISGDGSVVAFVSDASNLVPGDVNNGTDVFAWSRATGAMELVSLTSQGQQANDAWIMPRVDVSRDGRFVVFATTSPLDPIDTNRTMDVYLRDRVTGTTELVSVGLDGVPASGFSYEPTISDDGGVVAFTSGAKNLIGSAVNDFAAVYARDRRLGETQLVSRFSVAGLQMRQANHNSFDPAISGDGRFVAFTSLASNLLITDNIGQNDVFVYDRTGLGGTDAVSVDATNVNEGNRDSGSPSISYDGRYVAFSTSSVNMSPAGSNGQTHIYVRDRLTRTTLKVLSSTAGEGNNYSTDPSITPDGRFVAFTSFASNLVLPDQNGALDVLVYDLRTLMLSRESVGWEGREGNTHSTSPGISDDGRFVVFGSASINLVPVGLQQIERIYLRDRATCADGTVEGGRVTSATRGPLRLLPASAEPARAANCTLAATGA